MEKKRESKKIWKKFRKVVDNLEKWWYSNWAVADAAIKQRTLITEQWNNLERFEKMKKVKTFFGS